MNLNFLMTLKSKIITGLVVLGLVVSLCGVIYYLINALAWQKEETSRWKGNYTAQVVKTIQVNDSLSRSRTILLTQNDYIRSSDSIIASQRNDLDKLGVKVKDLQSASTIVITGSKDTITIPVVYWLPGDTVKVEIDSLIIGKLEIRRQKQSNNAYARWDVDYNPTLRIYIHDIKEGRWKIKNLFIPRKKYQVADVLSDDKFIDIKSAIVVQIKK